MSERRPAVFFYGSYMSREVLRDLDVAVDDVEVARLAGYTLEIKPLANLVECAASVAYGIVTNVAHADLTRLYEHAQSVLGGVYEPEAVLVQRPCGCFAPALCYVAADLRPAPAVPAYVERLLAPAQAYGFPAEYVDRIRSFLP